jgi:hypothetical protein
MPLRFSTGCVNKYESNGCRNDPDLEFCLAEGACFRAWYLLGGFQLFSSWEDNNVWGSDFRDSSAGDLEPNGGSDVPEIYFFSGHGVCQDPPGRTPLNRDDFIAVCSNFRRKMNRVNIRTSCRWGNGAGNLQFAFIDASCPMDLISIDLAWFPAFQGLHMAVGNSGTSDADTLDSVDRGAQFAAYTSGALSLLPHLSVGDAWMICGIIDVQPGCCAVALAAGNDRNDAIDRRENERVQDNRANPIPNWFAWRWICT